MCLKIDNSPPLIHHTEKALFSPLSPSARKKIEAASFFAACTIRPLNYIYTNGSHTYKVIEEIHEGASAHVFLVEPEQIPMVHLAIKVARASTGTKFIEAFKREENFLRQIQQKNCPETKLFPKLFDSFEISGGFALVLEYVPTNLKEFINQQRQEYKRKPNIVFIQKIAKQMMQAIRFLHEEMKIAHLDLKPENILIDPDTLEIKIIDFGISATLEQLKEMKKIETTLDYCPPEGVYQPKFSKSIDIWSVACILVELYIEKKLFDASHVFEIAQQFGTVLGLPPDTILDPLSIQFVDQFIPEKNRLTHSLDAQFLQIKREHALKVSFLNLLKSMLQYDPQARIDAGAALENHPFFKEESNQEA